MNNSGLNTLLLIIIAAIVAFGAWWFISEEQDQAGAEVEISLPGQSE